jgi:hypothetical protein
MILEQIAFGVIWHAWSELCAIKDVICIGKLIHLHMLNRICLTIRFVLGGGGILPFPNSDCAHHHTDLYSHACKPSHNYILLRSKSCWHCLAPPKGHKSINCFWGERLLHLNVSNTLPIQHEDTFTQKLESLSISSNIFHFNLVLFVQDRGSMAR